MTVAFRLLGDIGADVDGERVDIGHARQRAVLVAMLIDLNRPVPSDQLIYRVWADEPPFRTRNALSAYLSRLRAVIGRSGDVEIKRESGGYVLAADPMTVDLYRFRSLCRQARAATDPVEADDLFVRALQLWRGSPFVTLDTPWLNEVRNALDAERLAVVLDRNDAGLRAGRHAELLPELATMLREHPLDERLAGQLMLAQYRCGRQADALDTFRLMRERLVDELGADPSPALQQVHMQLLEGDPGRMGLPAAVSGRPRANLPRRSTSFVGRDDEVAHVVDVLGECSLVTLTGVGGVGKTRLALEAAARAEARFADGVTLVELAPLDDPAAVGHTVAAALRLQQRHGLGIEETVIDYLRTKKLLLILDNCEHLLDAAATLADSIVGSCPDVVVLATSREAIGVDGEHVWPVSPLPLGEATRLFADRAKASRPDFALEHEPVGAVAEICRRVDGLPLAIELAAARMRAMSSLDVARRLDGLRLLSGGARGSLRQQSLVATIDWSYQLLTGSEQQLFSKLSVFAGGFDLDAAHSVCGVGDEDDTLDSITGLVEKSMVIRLSAADRTRYSVLEMLRAYGRDRLRDNDIDKLLASRHAQYYTALAESAAAGMHGPDERMWVDRMLPDHDNLRVAFEYAISVEDVDTALRLVTSLPEIIHLRHSYESAGWAERAVEMAEATHPLYVAAVGFAARGAWNRGEFDKARTLANLAQGRAPARGTARVAYPGDVLADVALYEGDAGAALLHYEAEARRARSDSDPIRLVWTLFYISICRAALRVPAEGVAAAEEAVRVADETGNATAQSMGRYALGLVLKKSEPHRALQLFDDAAALAASVRNLWWHGIALMEAAATRAVHGEPAEAATVLIEVLDHWDRVGDWSQQWLNLRYVTRFFVRVGADSDALTLHQALVAAGKDSPLRDARIDPAQGSLTGAQAVALARSTLQRFAR
ncbi:BTAD domain-containing putative transcriptional regulator [Mycobacterium sp. GA-1285]|uniref:BTAD domain-containing putative transcriptional regulator n=1 Tax=Mycobacterium sp. GA-1285 TaxID=1772282 RepID=UPI0009E8EA9D|nr:BTAD domain-containing putative transcriptional regulator [Mycobacterium sp. GA-1285]